MKKENLAKKIYNQYLYIIKKYAKYFGEIGWYKIKDIPNRGSSNFNPYVQQGNKAFKDDLKNGTYFLVTLNSYQYYEGIEYLDSNNTIRLEEGRHRIKIYKEMIEEGFYDEDKRILCHLTKYPFYLHRPCLSKPLIIKFNNKLFDDKLIDKYLGRFLIEENKIKIDSLWQFHRLLGLHFSQFTDLAFELKQEGILIEPSDIINTKSYFKKELNYEDTKVDEKTIDWLKKNNVSVKK